MVKACVLLGGAGALGDCRDPFTLVFRLSGCVLADGGEDLWIDGLVFGDSGDSGEDCDVGVVR